MLHQKDLGTENNLLVSQQIAFWQKKKKILLRTCVLDVHCGGKLKSFRTRFLHFLVTHTYATYCHGYTAVVNSTGTNLRLIFMLDLDTGETAGAASPGPINTWLSCCSRNSTL